MVKTWAVSFRAGTLPPPEDPYLPIIQTPKSDSHVAIRPQKEASGETTEVSALAQQPVPSAQARCPGAAAAGSGCR